MFRATTQTQSCSKNRSPSLFVNFALRLISKRSATSRFFSDFYSSLQPDRSSSLFSKAPRLFTPPLPIF